MCHFRTQSHCSNTQCTSFLLVPEVVPCSSECPAAPFARTLDTNAKFAPPLPLYISPRQQNFETFSKCRLFLKFTTSKLLLVPLPAVSHVLNANVLYTALWVPLLPEYMWWTQPSSFIHQTEFVPTQSTWPLSTFLKILAILSRHSGPCYE